MQRTSLVQLPTELVRPPGASAGRYVMGIDGGATKTLAAVLDLQENVLHLAHGGPSNEDAIGVRAAVQALLDAADSAIGRAGVTEQSLAAAVLAVAGTDTEAIAAHLRARRSEHWLVVNDVVAAWATATEASAGVAAISGTGSNVFGVGRQGQTWRAGGWGHLLGDEGSGYWLGIHSIRAALRDRDGTGPPTALSDAAAAFFGTDSVEALATAVYGKPLTKGEISAFATHTASLAESGDAVACELFVRAAGELAHQIRAVIERTELHRAGEEFPVGLIGSAFKAGAVFVEPLTALVHETAPAAAVSVVEMAPVGGSLLLAARACGCPLQRDRLMGVLEEAAHELA
jgi:N-acetylglucosamine kinase-like BadF-type ATPase